MQYHVVVSVCYQEYHNDQVLLCIDMDKYEKIMLIGSFTTVILLLYITKPAPVNLLCDEWSESIDNKFTELDSQINSEETLEEYGDEWMNTQRKGLIHEIACSLYVGPI